MNGLAEALGALIAGAIVLALLAIVMAVITLIFPPPCGTWLADRACPPTMETSK